MTPALRCRLRLSYTHFTDFTSHTYIHILPVCVEVSLKSKYAQCQVHFNLGSPDASDNFWFPDTVDSPSLMHLGHDYVHACLKTFFV